VIATRALPRSVSQDQNKDGYLRQTGACTHS
jgi:hypothetical protein